MQPGDHLVIEGAFGMPHLYHHGVYVGDGRVVHFWSENGQKSKNRAQVRIDGLTAFQNVNRNAPVQIIPHSRRLPAEETVRKCLAKVGHKGYDVFNNNCEHLANECVLGHRYSSQADYHTNHQTRHPRATLKFGKVGGKLQFYERRS
jgi:hypothetical protein